MELHVSGGFCLLLALLLFLDEDNLVPWALFACFLHEMGHCMAIRYVGGRVSSLHLSVVGAEIIPERHRMFSYREEFIIAAAGPAVSILVALASSLAARAPWPGQERMLLFAGLNLAAGIFNLLPLGPLDGGRMLRIALLRANRMWEVEQFYQKMTLVLSLGLISLGVSHLLHSGGNPTLFLSGLWLLSTAKHENA